MTRTVGDVALIMSVIAGPDPRDRHSIPVGDVDWTKLPLWKVMLRLPIAF
jgi:aspartyl-tRNA(Asn)/glutamyl-tRNA(Gln) amidotransferase subunit A